MKVAVIGAGIAGITAAASGDLESILRLHVRGLDLNIGDYD